MRTPNLLRLGAFLATAMLTSLFAAPAAPRDVAGHTLKVSENRRFLVWDNGAPFFYLGDTAWELFHKLNREEADRYLSDRASKGYTVVQAVALAELDGLNTPNAYGHKPLQDNDPTKPLVADGPDNDYWDHVDYVVNRANELGIIVGLLPTWGDKWNKMWGAGPVIFNPENAQSFGEWLGRRYRDKGVIWILGGDRPVLEPLHTTIIERMAAGLRRGDGGRHLMTFHPPGGEGSSTWWHNAEWLDFNTRQNGHEVEYTRYNLTLKDYERTPTKPVIDSEPVYEDHPVAFKADQLGHTVSADTRRPLYWDLFNGACGHTYGHHSVWQMFKGTNPINNPLMTWDVAIQQPGAGQMQYARWLLESRPILARIPDPTMIVEQTPKSSWPGEGRYRFVATRDSSGSYAMVYVPAGRAFKVKLASLSGTTVRAWWFNPRDGSAKLIGEFAKTDVKEFNSPTPGELLDWVLVLDDAARNFPAPGTRS